MRKFLLSTAFIIAPLLAEAEEFDLKKVDVYAEDTIGIYVQTLEGKHWENYKWKLQQTYMPILFEKIKSLSQTEYKDWGLNVINPDTDYRGLEITIELKDGTKLDPFVVHDGSVRSGSKLITEDPNRAFEYWFYSVNTSLTNRKISARVLPIFTFKQCEEVGNPIIYTNPEQCLMADQNIFLNVPEMPTQKSLEVSTFDECLTEGEAIIDTFPRRCIMAGGHVFTEPPRVFNPPQKVRTKRYSTEDFLK